MMAIELNALASKLSEIPAAEIDEAVALASSDWEADWRSLQIMLSSPLKTLREERTAICDALGSVSPLQTQLFEKMPDSGLCNVRESVALARRCDMVVALFDPEYLGSPMDIAERPPGYLDCAYYSELEMEIALRRNQKHRLPRIFIYVKTNLGEIPELTRWHVNYVDKIAPRYFSSTEQLIQLVTLDVLGTAIALRSSRLRILSKRLHEAEDRLRVADARIKPRSREILNSA